MLLVGALSLLSILLIGTGWFLGGRSARRGVGERSRRRNLRAQDGEDEAVAILQEHGFRILERQTTALWWMEVDGELAEIEVRADFLVEEEEDGSRYVAEVKTGRQAPAPSFAATRRQLLEYAHVFAPLGILLVDVEARAVHEVAFPGEAPEED